MWRFCNMCFIHTRALPRSPQMDPSQRPVCRTCCGYSSPTIWKNLGGPTVCRAHPSHACHPLSTTCPLFIVPSATVPLFPVVVVLFFFFHSSTILFAGEYCNHVHVDPPLVERIHASIGKQCQGNRMCCSAVLGCPCVFFCFGVWEDEN